MAGGGGRPFPDRQKEPWEAVCSVTPRRFAGSWNHQCDLPVLSFSGPRASVPYAFSLNLGGLGRLFFNPLGIILTFCPLPLTEQSLLPSDRKKEDWSVEE